MPAQMLHLTVANKVHEKLNANDLGSFYLGAISPDAIHARKGSGREDKWITHLQLRNKRLWLLQVQKFIQKGKAFNMKDFYIGYASHVLTDYLWLSEIFIRTQARHDEDLAPVLDHTGAYYNDLVLVDYEMYLKSEWTDAVFDLVRNTKAIEVQGLLSADEINKWRNTSLDWFETDQRIGKEPLKYMSMDEIDKFVDNAAEFTANQIASGL